MTMQWILFLVFIAVFVSTAAITLLGLIQKVQIKEGYLKGLYAALILEVIGVLIGLGQNADFFGNSSTNFLNKLPEEVKASSIEESINKIKQLTQRPEVCSAWDDNFISKLPEDLQRATPEATIENVNDTLKSCATNNLSLSGFVSSLPSEIKGININGTREKIEQLIKKYGEVQSKINLLNLELEECQNDRNSCGLNETGLLPKLMVLQNDIQRFGNINFLWKQEEKREIAFRVLEVMGELGHYQGKAEANPETAHETILNFQKMKKIFPSNGRFGRKTLLQLFNDFLNLE